MFAVDESTAEAIRRALYESGELAAVVELRRRFPGLIDGAQARSCVRIIAGWKPGAGASFPPWDRRKPPTA